jgi:hypothetical protein
VAEGVVEGLHFPVDWEGFQTKCLGEIEAMLENMDYLSRSSFTV